MECLETHFGEKVSISDVHINKLEMKIKGNPKLFDKKYPRCIYFFKNLKILKV